MRRCPPAGGWRSCSADEAGFCCYFAVGFFLAGFFFLTAFFLVGFFFVVVFLAAFVRVVLLAGPFSARALSRSSAYSKVTCSSEDPRGSEALVWPSVT